MNRCLFCIKTRTKVVFPSLPRMFSIGIRSRNWCGHGGRLYLCPFTHLCVDLTVICGPLFPWKIQSWPISHFCLNCSGTSESLNTPSTQKICLLWRNWPISSRILCLTNEWILGAFPLVSNQIHFERIMLKSSVWPKGTAWVRFDQFISFLKCSLVFPLLKTG